LFTHRAVDGAAMSDSARRLDGWLRQHGFALSTEPGSARMGGMRSGAWEAGTTESWYRGSFAGSPEFSLQVSQDPAPGSSVRGSAYLESYGSKKDMAALEGHANDFGGELRKFIETVDERQ
jgi:hypothetical protein